MKILAIDTSTEIASVALLVGEELLCEEQHNQKTHAQFILPMIDQLMVEMGLQIHQLDGIVFGCGPGSFTGLRIACSIAKGLAYGHDLGVIPVSTLGAIAFEVRQQKEYANFPVLAVLDARMNQMYWSYFPKESWTGLDRVNSVEEIQIPPGESAVLAGVGIDLYWSNFTESLKSQIVSQITVYPKAGSMIQLAMKAGLKPISAEKAQPVYVRNQVTHEAKNDG